MAGTPLNPFIAVGLTSTMWRRYSNTLIAVVGGNFLYFVILSPYLPPNARHKPYRMDWGLVVDFWVCLAIYGLLAFGFRSKRK